MTEFRRLAIPAVVEVQPRRHGDARGWFMETYSAAWPGEYDWPATWVQDNHSRSAAAGTVRGLHFQAPPAAQAKLVRVLRGAIFDVAVDIRAGSASYGRWVGLELSAEAGNQLYVPTGFAHGFMTLRPDTEVAYKVSAPYAPATEGAIRWDDPALGIDWPSLATKPSLSDKDRVAPGFAARQTPF